MKNLADALIVEEFRKHVESEIRKQLKGPGFIPGCYLKLQHTEENGGPTFGFVPIMPGMFDSEASKQKYREGIQQVVDSVDTMFKGSSVLVSIFTSEMWYITRTPDQIPNGDFRKVEAPSQASDRTEGIMMCLETSKHAETAIYSLIKDEQGDIIDITQGDYEKKMSEETSKTTIGGLFSHILYKPELFRSNMTQEQKDIRDKFAGIISIEDDKKGDIDG